MNCRRKLGIQKLTILIPETATAEPEKVTTDKIVATCGWIALGAKARVPAAQAAKARWLTEFVSPMVVWFVFVRLAQSLLSHKSHLTQSKVLSSKEMLLPGDKQKLVSWLVFFC